MDLSQSDIPLRKVGLGLAVMLLVAAALPQPTRAAVSDSYSFRGYEYWFTSTVAYFAGSARGTSGDTAAWEARIVHSVEISPTGTVDGGHARLVTSDLTRVRGDFAPGGSVVLIDAGASCGNIIHTVEGDLVDVSRSDTGAVGEGRFEATLIHHRRSVLGRCITYAASATGTITLSF